MGCCSAAYRLDCHVRIGMGMVGGIVVQPGRRDVERPWRLVAVRHQDVAGCP
jgi:hypothetical protein